MPAPQMIETPAMRRSAMLAQLLEQQRQPVEIRGGYGELAARLLGQGITQFGANRAERAVRDERARRTTGEADAFGLTLASVLRDSGGAPPATDMPPVAPPPMVPPVSNTQQPVEAMTAPVAAVAGSPMRPAAPAGMPAAMPPMADVPPMPQLAAPPVNAPQVAPQIAPQSAANPLGITPGEMARIQEGVDAFRRTGDPAIGAWVRGEIDLVRQRMSAPAAERREVTDQNGVKYLVDPTGATPPVPLFGEQGVPELARTRTVVAGPNDPFGMVEGTTYSINPSGVASTVQTPTAGYRRLRDGTLVPETGGREDLGGNQTARFTAITGEQQRIRPLLDQATAITRNIQAVRAGVGAQNGAGDIAAVNGLQRLIDDGVVKEGDVNLQLEVQGIAGGLAGLRGYLSSSGRFSPEIRAQISGVAETLYGTQMPMIREQVMGRREFLDRSLGAGAFDDVVPPSVRQAYGWEEAPAPRPQPRPAAPSRPRQPAAPPRSNGQTRRYNPNTGQLE
jgi:hypothetical protein